MWQEHQTFKLRYFPRLHFRFPSNKLFTNKIYSKGGSFWRFQYLISDLWYRITFLRQRCYDSVFETLLRLPRLWNVMFVRKSDARCLRSVSQWNIQPKSNKPFCFYSMSYYILFYLTLVSRYYCLLSFWIWGKKQ